MVAGFVRGVNFLKGAKIRESLTNFRNAAWLFGTVAEGYTEGERNTKHSDNNQSTVASQVQLEAPTARNEIAWGNAPGNRQRLRTRR
jgi:hypothetical protein